MPALKQTIPPQTRFSFLFSCHQTREALDLPVVVSLWLDIIQACCESTSMFVKVNGYRGITASAEIVVIISISFIYKS